MTLGCRTALTFLTAFLMMALPGTLGASAEERIISFYNIHTKNSVTVVYKRNGQFDEDALKKLNWITRDWREDEATEMDPRLFDLLWEMHRELGSQKPIHVISGYRSPKTNEMLRKTRGGQARKSQHMLGQAIDVHFPDVPVRSLRYSAMVRQAGGVGYYPTSSIPFVHVDTGRVRHWPRMKREELALLFPNGKSRHLPTDNKPLSATDAVAARSSNPKLAMVVAGFHELRKGGSGKPREPLPAPGQLIANWSTEVAAAVPRPAAPPPQLVLAGLSEPAGISSTGSGPRLSAAPKLAAAGFTHARNHQPLARSGVNATEQRMLTHLASLAAESDTARGLLAGPIEAPDSNEAAPFASGGNGTAGAGDVIAAAATDDPIGMLAAALERRPVKKLPTVAPEFDEEHPDELSYRPFPIAPYLTQTDSSDDPALAQLFRPDAKLTLAFMEFAGDLPSTGFTAGPSIAPRQVSDTFSGPAVRFIAFLRPAESGEQEVALSTSSTGQNGR